VPFSKYELKEARCFIASEGVRRVDAVEACDWRGTLGSPRDSKPQPAIDRVTTLPYH
jgi:hypothetical protein